MRITNLLHFSEYHRFYVVRDFALSSLDYKVLTAVYQPMIGAYALSIYYTLFHQLAADKAGCSEIEQQRKLFLALELEAGERGRKHFVEQTSRLEAVGLLKTSRRFAAASEDYVYEYTLYAPEKPADFFRNQHLTLLLRDKVGKYAVFALRDELVRPEPDELKDANAENLSVPFYELFRLNTQVVDYELEQAFFESAAAEPAEGKPEVTYKGYQYAEIIMHFPRESLNREYVERLKYETEQMATINFVAKKYSLYLTDVCRLLDEDGVFDEEGRVVLELLQHKANQVFRADKKRSDDRTRMLAKVNDKQGDSSRDGDEDGQSTGDKIVEMEFYLDVPDIFQGECNQHQYNYILRNEPYTFLLEKIFSKGSVPDGLLDTLSKVDLNYGLREEVINVLIHYIYVNKRSWSRTSIEFSVTDMLGKQVSSFEQAVQYIREQMKYTDKKASRSAQSKSGGGTAAARGGRGGVRQKPVIPIVKDAPAAKQRSEAEREALRKKAQQLDGQR
ncbi:MULTISPECIES: helicase DnaB [unclassified Paenibacillus]|uniref:helicase DnaB n=1 Tax=unclassified Paenibacillus TaxID=185978 RepID=UPI001AE1DA7B|nr:MULTISPECIES: helicase DnaB [unclassified Paenibacillus]MBP1156760.1 replication initiation and membrane attachment protein [Paenibacillus sp. PvP091]MBP1172501.1 replication initiation and membrane attachment protein [Paenibacillus sp. PvR098]MBP2438882.1 replication initiation and membrane attachment protein [Paenibacillus sp. PvP052]